MMFEIDQNESSLTLVGWAAFVFVKFFCGSCLGTWVWRYGVIVFVIFASKDLSRISAIISYMLVAHSLLC